MRETRANSGAISCHASGGMRSSPPPRPLPPSANGASSLAPSMRAAGRPSSSHSGNVESSSRYVQSLKSGRSYPDLRSMSKSRSKVRVLDRSLPAGAPTGSGAGVGAVAIVQFPRSFELPERPAAPSTPRLPRRARRMVSIEIAAFGAIFAALRGALGRPAGEELVVGGHMSHHRAAPPIAGSSGMGGNARLSRSRWNDRRVAIRRHAGTGAAHDRVVEPSRLRP